MASISKQITFERGKSKHFTLETSSTTPAKICCQIDYVCLVLGLSDEACKILSITWLPFPRNAKSPYKYKQLNGCLKLFHSDVSYCTESNIVYVSQPFNIQYLLQIHLFRYNIYLRTSKFCRHIFKCP